jgi:putative ABC transport system permease protein
MTARVRSWLRQLRFFLRRDRAAAELEEEMRLHRELRAEQLRRRGMSGSEAAVEARRRFGNVTIISERSGDMWGYGSLDQLRQDVRFAARRLRQRPAFSIPVIVILALGIGATTAVFAAVDAAMIRSLPFVRPERLVTLTNVNVPLDVARERASGGRMVDITDIARMPELFSHVAAYAVGGMNLSDEERPLRIKAGVVSGTFFATLGARPHIGRTFSAEESRPGGPDVVVLSHALWQRQFGGADVVGRPLRLHGRTYQVVGIMPAGFSFPSESDLWIPMTVPVTFRTFEPFRGWLPQVVLARLAPGASLDAAQARVLAAWDAQVNASEPDRRTNLQDFADGVRKQGAVTPLHRKLLGDRRRALLVLLGATGLLLLIACANVANLLLSDAAARRREIAVREVLGASKGRIVRQLLSESLMLGLVGAGLGIALAPAALKVLRALMPAQLAGVAPAQVDGRLLAFAALLGIVTSVLFGLWPSLGAAGTDASAAVKSGGGHGATGRLGRARQSLVILELALTVMLLVGAGLMLRSFGRLMAEPVGLNPQQVATAEMSLPRTMNPEARKRVVNAVVATLASQPDLLGAGAVNDLPLRGGGGIALSIQVPDAPPAPRGEMRFARNLYTTPGYFGAMGIALLRGRLFDDSDLHTGRPVAVINEAMARKWWGERDPVGRWFTFPGDTTRIAVVGVVANVREERLDAEPNPQMFQPIGNVVPYNIAFVARGALPPAALMARLSDAVRTAAPGEPLYNVRTMEQVISASVLPRRMNTVLIALFAALALVLSALGVYAVVAYGVAQRTREFGIRLALGARGADLVRLVTGEIGRVLVIGLALGVAGAWAASRVLASLLYEVDVRDPLTFAAVPLVLLLPAIIAALVPAVRAARVDPRQVMQAD